MNATLCTKLLMATKQSCNATIPTPHPTNIRLRTTPTTQCKPSSTTQLVLYLGGSSSAKSGAALMQHVKQFCTKELQEAVWQAGLMPRGESLHFSAVKAGGGEDSTAATATDFSPYISTATGGALETFSVSKRIGANAPVCVVPASEHEYLIVLRVFTEASIKNAAIRDSLGNTVTVGTHMNSAVGGKITTRDSTTGGPGRQYQLNAEAKLDAVVIARTCDITKDSETLDSLPPTRTIYPPAPSTKWCNR